MILIGYFQVMLQVAIYIAVIKVEIIEIVVTCMFFLTLNGGI